MEMPTTIPCLPPQHQQNHNTADGGQMSCQKWERREWETSLQLIRDLLRQNLKGFGHYNYVNDQTQTC